MDDYVDAIVRVKVPKWQIGEEVSVHFPDTMMKRGKCEALDESVIQEVLNKRCMTAVANEYLISLHGKRPKGEWKPIGDFVVKCSVCGVESFETPFCHKFGADMRGAE